MQDTVKLHLCLSDALSSFQVGRRAVLVKQIDETFNEARTVWEVYHCIYNYVISFYTYTFLLGGGGGGGGGGGRRVGMLQV